MKKLIVSLCILLILVGCSSGEKEFSWDHPIHVISREDGSGTRGAFTQLTGISKKDSHGDAVDFTTVEAAITNSTSVVMTGVSGDVHAIGYLSLGSLNDSVKPLSVDGITPTGEHIKNNTYPIARPFLLVTKDPLAYEFNEFIKFIMSEEGQKIVEDTGYVSMVQGEAYQPTGISGHIVVGGSSSVTPVIEKLKEAFEKAEPLMTIEVQQSDSTTGITSALSGVYDIGMSSRLLTEAEEEPLHSFVIAQDGIVVIANNKSPLTNLSMKDVYSIFTGEAIVWSEVKKEESIEET